MKPTSKQAAYVFLWTFVWVLLVCAALNSLSYFVRSTGWGNLFGTSSGETVGLGFPLLVWEDTSTRGPAATDALAIVLNILFATALGLVAGVIAVWITWRGWLPPIELPTDLLAKPAPRPLQFTLRQLLAFTAIIACFLMLLHKEFELRRQALQVVYLAGPCAIAWVAHLSRQLAPLIRPAVTSLLALLLAAGAALLAQSLSGINDFTRGLLGIFVCWVPQFVLLAIVVGLWQTFMTRRS